MKRLFLPLCAVLLAANPYTSSAEQTYRVKKGDSLYRIAKSHKVDLQELKTANHLSSNQLKPGTTLVLPSKGHKTAAGVKSDTRGEDTSRHQQTALRTASDSAAAVAHTVRKGDTLGSISREYSVSVDELRTLNHLSPKAKLKIGAVLSVRRAAGSGGATAKTAESVPLPENRYTVQKGDTAWSIARRFDLTVDELVGLNSITPEGLKVGQELVVAAKGTGAPKGHDGETRAAKAASSEPEGRGAEAAPKKDDPAVVRVRVSRGDTLKALAREYGTSVEELRALNGFKKKEKLKAGTSLIVKRGTAKKEEAPGTTTYVVRRGDNLRKIARKFHTSVEELARLNGIGRRGIKVGQKLLVAAPETPRSVEALADAVEAKAAEASLDSDLKTISASGAEQAGLTERVIRVARRMLDIPYKFGGNSVRGIDCSAYVQKVFRFLNVPLPRTAREQFNHGLDIPREELASGDLVFFKTYAKFPSHVGIYLGNNKFIHASSIGKKVTIDSLEAPYYSKRFIGGRRLVDEPASGDQPAGKSTADESAG
ncbi:MAG: LysM peptidoglycan-binding domain-containing protein [Deltaproteobacteria bacterium]|nr:LysM peptidoglycan-binding domain-containing protein [Deltaproteobacteria bacterium]